MKAEKIISQIKALLDQLSTLAGSTTPKTIGKRHTTSSDVPKGAVGALNMLLTEGFLDTPKDISTIMEKLTEIGHYHKQTAIAMNLLNLTKRRVLNRFKNKEKKNWEYVIRK